jgi:uncharacterized protein YbaP (TraB family)
MLKEVAVETYLQLLLEGPLDEVIENLQELKEKHSKKFTNLRIDISIYDNGDCEMVLFGEREETPGEVKNRLSQEEQSLKVEREMELRQLEILKKKYE